MRRGLERIRTLSSTKQRSIPLKQRSVYIELFLLSTERDRYIHEHNRLAKSIYRVHERLNGIDSQLDKLKSTLEEREGKISKKQKERNKQWNTIKLSY